MPYQPSPQALEKFSAKLLKQTGKVQKTHPQSELNRHLMRFWTLFQDAKIQTQRLRILQDTARTAYVEGWTGRTQTRRSKHERLKKQGRVAEGVCRVCFAKAQVLHHIVMLARGGNNDRRNLIALCHDCHNQVHPWLESEGLNEFDAEAKSHMRSI